jgi:outer membrane protein OmpA-like peptidoglycan-associated protein
VSSPGAGNGGAPTDPGEPPGGSPGAGTPQPDCRLGGCSTPGPGSGSGEDGGGGTSCPAVIAEDLSADTLFAFDSSTLLPAGTLALDKLIARAKEIGLDLATIKVTGYTDPLGSDAHNLALSQARAEAVANYLSARGLTAPNVEVKGLGATNFVKPLSACPAGPEQKACLAPNRRVVVELIPK